MLASYKKSDSGATLWTVDSGHGAGHEGGASLALGISTERH